jgi:predicted transposase YdaD
MQVEDIKSYNRHKNRDMVPKQFWIDAYEEGQFEGRQIGEGEARGKAEGKAEAVIGAFRFGIPISQITQIVNLTEAEVTSILKAEGLH